MSRHPSNARLANAPVAPDLGKTNEAKSGAFALIAGETRAFVALPELTWCASWEGNAGHVKARCRRAAFLAPPRMAGERVGGCVVSLADSDGRHSRGPLRSSSPHRGNRADWKGCPNRRADHEVSPSASADPMASVQHPGREDRHAGVCSERRGMHVGVATSRNRRSACLGLSGERRWRATRAGVGGGPKFERRTRHRVGGSGARQRAGTQRGARPGRWE